MRERVAGWRIEVWLPMVIVALDQLTVRLVGKERLRQPRHDERIDHPENDRRDERHQDGDYEIACEIHDRWSSGCGHSALGSRLSAQPSVLVPGPRSSVGTN